MSNKDKKEAEYNDELDIIKDITTIHSEDEEIHSDYVYAKLGDTILNKEEKYVTEMTYNANLIKRIFKEIKNKLEQRKKEYEKHGATQKELEEIENQINQIETISQETYSTYIKRVRMLLALRRNKPNNYLIEAILNKIQTIKEEENENQKQNKIINYLDEKLKPNQK